ncbi:unnamed protein product [Dicrocoelium dendriticum]|nr:unnamed protein product [Dicrocoelium dendriticum]
MGYSEEQALALLTWHKADFEGARNDLPNFSPLRYEWTAYERRVFFLALDYYNKQFHKIKKLFKKRTVNELILFYYLNKRNQQTLYEMSLFGPKWTGLHRRGYLTPGMLARTMDGSPVKGDSHQKSSFDFDPTDPVDMEIRRYLDSLRGIVSSESTQEGDCETAASLPDSPDSDEESETRLPSGGYRKDNNLEGHGDMRTSKSSATACRKRKRPRGRPRNSHNINIPSLDLPSPLPSSYNASISRLSMRKHARFEEQLAAVANLPYGQTERSSLPPSNAPTEVLRRRSRRGVTHSASFSAPVAKLPDGVYYVHKEFLSMCHHSADQHKEDIHKLEELAHSLSFRIDENVRVRLGASFCRLHNCSFT